jgi:ribosomal protein S18 acetylase RimI-like enzyme
VLIKMSMSLPRLEILHSEKDVEAAGVLAAETMKNSVSYVEIFRGEEGWRKRQLEIFFANFIRLKLMCGADSVRMARDESDNALLCSFMFANSTHRTPSFWNKVQVGILEIPFRANFASFSRLIKIDDYHHKELAIVIGERPHYFVNMMVVAPSQQGRGVGSSCLRQALQEADDVGYPVVLSTNLEINVRFYSKLSVYKRIYSLQV